MLSDAMGKARQPTKEDQGQGQGQMVEGPQGTTPASKSGKQYLDRAIQIVYEGNFEELVQLFQTHGKPGFPQAMSIAINGTLDRLEQETGEPLPLEISAEVGAGLIEVIMGDLSEGGILPPVDKKDVLRAIERTMNDWVKSHPDRVNPDEAKASIEQMAQVMAQEGMLDQGVGAGQTQAPQAAPQQQGGMMSRSGGGMPPSGPQVAAQQGAGGLVRG